MLLVSAICWCFQGGLYLLNIVDFSVGGFPLLVIGLAELVAVNWIYGLWQAFIYLLHFTAYARLIVI